MCVGGSHAGEIRDRTWKRAGSQKQDLRTGLLAPLHGSPIEHRGLRSLLMLGCSACGRSVFSPVPS